MSFMSALMPGSGAPPQQIPGTAPRIPVASKARNTPQYQNTSGFGLGSDFDVLGLGKYADPAPLKPIQQGILASLSPSVVPTPQYGYKPPTNFY